jgi:hypothetical protein
MHFRTYVPPCVPPWGSVSVGVRPAAAGEYIMQRG